MSTAGGCRCAGLSITPSPPCSRTRSAVRSETAGNPFFLLEMASHLSEAGAFDRDVVRLGETSAEIPQSIRDMIRSRLRRLPDRCVETLAIASLIGERFDADLLASAASQADAATVDLLEEAARAGLITELDVAELEDEPDCWR